MKAVIVKSRCSEFPAKLLFASCGAPLIKDIMQNGNCIIDVFLKWRLITPNSFTSILPQHWKLTLYCFLILQHSDSTVSRIVSTSTPSIFLLPSIYGPSNSTGQHRWSWCMWEKENWIFGRSPGWISASITPALQQAHRRFSSIFTDVPITPSACLVVQLKFMLPRQRTFCRHLQMFAFMLFDK